MRGIVGQTAVSVGRMASSRPASIRVVATSTAATRIWTSARIRGGGAAVSYAVPRTR
ncbi:MULTISPECIES: hypothetical protein [unclassified Nocardioides]|uniref:hypothetical protein n=1 Tax=unclassified Nocardioides TaxID=2615069 RepID=UPI0030156B7B